MGIRDDEMLRGGGGGSLGNGDSLRSRMPAEGLARAVSQRAVPPDTSAPRAALSAQPGAALNAATEARSARVALGAQPGAALNDAVAERAPRVAFGAQPGAALHEAVNARMGPPTPSRIRMAAAQPGEALVNAIQSRPAAPDGMMVAQPRTAYLLGGSGETVPPAPKPLPALLQAPTVEGQAHLAGNTAAPAPRAAPASGSSPLMPRPIIGPGLATPAKPPAPPAAAPNAPAVTPEGQAHLSGRSPVTVARSAPAGAPPPRQIIGPGLAAPVPAPAAPAAAPGSPPMADKFVPANNASQPNPNVASRSAPRTNGLPHSGLNTGAMSPEAAAWQAQRAAQTAAVASPTAPATPAAQEGLVSRLRGMFGLGDKAAAAAPPAPAAAGQPGAIRQAAQSAFGSAEQWSDWRQNSKTVQNLGKVARGVGTVAKVAAAPLGAIETYQGIQEGDSAKAAWGAGDTAAGAALFTPAAPAAGAYLATRTAYELGQKAPEGFRDAIGSGINQVAQLFGGGADDRAWKRMEAEHAARQQQGAVPAAMAPSQGGAATKTSPIAHQAKAAVSNAPAVPPMANNASPGPAQPNAQTAALTQRYNALQTQLDESPIARAVLGGGQSAVYYKDGTVHNLQAGEALPDDVQQFLAIGNAMGQIENGQYQLPAAGAASSAQPAATASSNPKVAQFAAQYGGAAQLAGQELGVDPNVLLAKWGLETGWGKSVIPGTNNLGNIKDFSGGGVAATDNMTGSRDNYAQFADPKAFAAHYVDLISRKFPGAVGAGSDMARFAAGLNPGQPGGYAQDPEYANKLTAAMRMLGPINASSSTPMESPALAMLDGEAPPAAGQAPVRAGAGRAPYDPAPVQMLRGMESTMALPNGGGAGYTEVPTGVYQAGVRGGNASLAGRGPIADYAASVAQGENFAANPAGAKLAAEDIRAEAEKYKANQEYKGRHEAAEAQATSAKHQVFTNEQQVGVDNLGNPIMGKVAHVMGADGKSQPAVPQANYARPQAAHIEALRANPAMKTAFDAKFGPGSADYHLNKKEK